MNFFEAQDTARTKTRFLILGFILAIITVILIIDGAVLLIYAWWNNKISANLYPPPYLRPRLDIINLFIFIIIFFGSLIRYLKLKSGGASIVELIQATPLERNSQAPEIKQLFNVVDEISIASGVIAPSLYVLQKEAGINAFVAGYSPNDTVLVVTQGALDNLNRNEMQGMIAHEYSHIFNSDASINLKIMIVLGGLIGVSEVGSFLMRTKHEAAVVSLAGFILNVSGSIGLLCGNILRAAISRQRETLADACAVQYTRDPSGIASALLKIQEQEEKALMNSPYAEAINHMCFSTARDMSFFGIFSSHPKLNVRIAKLDPNGEIRANFMQGLKQKSTTNVTIEKQAPLKNAVNAHTIDSSKIVTAIGNPTVYSLHDAEVALNNIGSDLSAMLQAPTETMALMYAIAINTGTLATNIYNSSLIPKEIQASIVKCINNSDLKNPQTRNILTNLAISILKQLPPHKKQVFMQNMASILESNVSMSKALLLTVLVQRLHEDSFKHHRIQYSNFKTIEADIICVVWFLAKQTDNPDSPDKNFLATMQIMNSNFNKHIHEFKFNANDLMHSLLKLRFVAPNIKQQLIDACTNCIVQDEQIYPAEIELLRAICTCLDCPLPLLKSTLTTNSRHQG